MRHYLLLSVIADAIGNSSEVNDALCSGEETLTVQIGDNMENPIGIESAPYVVILSEGAREVNNSAGFLDHSVSIVAGFDKDSKTTTAGDYTKIVYDSVEIGDTALNKIKTAIYDAIKPYGLIINSFNRGIFTELTWPLCQAMAEITIEEPQISLASKQPWVVSFDASFGDVDIGETDDSVATIVHANEVETRTFTITAASDNPAFTIIGTNPFTLAPADTSKTVSVRFTPLLDEEYTGTITFTDNLGFKIKYDVSGTGITP